MSAACSAAAPMLELALETVPRINHVDGEVIVACQVRFITNRELFVSLDGQKLEFVTRASRDSASIQRTGANSQTSSRHGTPRNSALTQRPWYNYNLSFLEFYKSAICGSGTLPILECLNLMTCTDATSSERVHSFQAKRTHEPVTHMTEFSFLCAENVCAKQKQTGFWQLSKTTPARSSREHPSCASKIEKKRGDIAAQRNHNSGPWRAFLHVHDERLGELSEAYRNLGSTSSWAELRGGIKEGGLSATPRRNPTRSENLLPSHQSAAVMKQMHSTNVGRRSCTRPSN